MMLKKNPKSAIHPSSSKSSAHGGDFSSDDGEQGIDSPSKSVDDGNSDYAECAVGSKLGKGNGEDSNGHGPKTQGGNNNQQQPLKCDQCDYETFSFALLQTHQRGHENDPKKPFQCDICNMKFSNGANMRRHRVRHTGVKPFECRVCQKRFFRKDHLAEHMTTHNKKLPFHCPVCNKGFQRQIAMRAHFQNEHVGNAEGQKTCGLCGYNAGSLKGLGVHMAKKHGIDLDDPSPAAAAAAAAAAHLVASGHGFHESPLMHSLHFGAVNMDQQQSCPPSPTPPMGLLPSHFLAPQVEISLAQPPSPSNAQSLMEVRDCSSPSPPPPTSTSGSFIKSALVTALAINMHGANGHPKGSLQKLSPKSTGSCGSSSGSSMSDHSEDEPRLTIDTGEYPTLYSIKREHTDSSDGISPPQKRFCGAESLKKRFLSRLDGNDAVAPNSSTNAANADSNNNTNGEYRDNDDDTNQTTNGEGSRSPSPGATNLIKVSPLKSLLRHQQFQSNGQQNTDPFHPNHPSLPVGFFPAKFGHQCVFCSIVFPDQTLYFLHKGFHSEGNPWKCNICSEQYANVYEFNAHLLSKSHQ